MKIKPVFLVMLVCILTLSFVFVSCKTDDDDGGGGGGGNVTSVTITGLDGKSGDVLIKFYVEKDVSDTAYSEEVISNNKVTFSSPMCYDTTPLKNGSYFLNVRIESDHYVYTNGAGTDGLGSGDNIGNSAAVKIDLSGDVTISFDKFKLN